MRALRIPFTPVDGLLSVHGARVGRTRIVQDRHPDFPERDQSDVGCGQRHQKVTDHYMLSGINLIDHRGATRTVSTLKFCIQIEVDLLRCESMVQSPSK